MVLSNYVYVIIFAYYRERNSNACDFLINEFSSIPIYVYKYKPGRLVCASLVHMRDGNMYIHIGKVKR